MGKSSVIQPRLIASAFLKLHGPLPAENHQNGLQENAQVQTHAPLSNVLFVQLHHFFKIGDFAPAADLPHSGDTGLGRQPGTVVQLIFVPFIHRWGPGAD